jgi:hypothetical protein
MNPWLFWFDDSKNDTENNMQQSKITEKKINLGSPPSVSSTAAETKLNWASIETGRSRNEICTGGTWADRQRQQSQSGKSTIQIWRLSYEQDRGYSMVDVRNLKRINANRRKLGRAQGSLLTRESREGKENQNGEAGILRCSAREIDSSTQPNKQEKRNTGRALVRADRKTSARFSTHENWDNEETQGR